MLLYPPEIIRLDDNVLALKSPVLQFILTALVPVYVVFEHEVVNDTPYQEDITNVLGAPRGACGG